MMKNRKLHIAECTTRSKNIIDRARDLLKEINYPDINKLPKDIYDAKKGISIVFAGQYSAGKSTIIKALTGIENIEIGVPPKTNETHKYEWNGITIIDTPGIRTGVYPEHDEKANNAIKNADILGYVVPDGMLDDLIGKNFRELLFDEAKAEETIMIVNKIIHDGDMEKIIANKLEALEEVTAPYRPKTVPPYGPKDLRCVFIDAESYLDSLTEADKDKAEIKEGYSNYCGLERALKDFIKDKGISSRLTTPLYQTRDLLQQVINEHQPSTGDRNIDAEIKQLFAKRNFYKDIAQRLELSAGKIITDTKHEINKIGREVVNSTNSKGRSIDNLKGKIEDAKGSVENAARDCFIKINKEIDKISKEYDEELSKFYDSASFNGLLENLNTEVGGIDSENKDDKKSIIRDILLKNKNIEKIVTGIGKTIESLAKGPDGKTSGSLLYKIYKKYGDLKGIKFKPWGIRKPVEKVGTGAGTLGDMAGVFGLAQMAYDEINDRKRKESLRKLQNAISEKFNTCASETETYFKEGIGNCVYENCYSQISEIDSKIDEINRIGSAKNETYRKLEALINECMDLIKDIHEHYSPDKTYL